MNYATWAKTPEQQRMAETLEETGGNVLKASRLLKLPRGKVRRFVDSTKAKMSLQGISPEHDRVVGIPDPFVLKGTSTLYKVAADGTRTPKLQWVKDKLDQDAHRQIVEACIASAVETLAPEPSVVKPERADDNLANLVIITDYHMGAKAWAPETGSDWDLDLAESTLYGAFDQLIDGAPKASKIVLGFLGDFLHFDSLEAVTPTSRHLLDAAGTMEQVADYTIRSVRRIIRKARETHEKVVVVFAEGNHDLTTSLWMRKLLLALYEECEDVEVVGDPLPYYVVEHGETMIAFHHGHLTKKENLPQFFAAKFYRQWGRTTKRYIHTGHYHHLDEKAHAGARVYQHPTLAANDSYSARHGYVEDREACLITYSARYGQIARKYVCPAMLEVDACREKS
jgi:hypothetical protein